MKTGSFSMGKYDFRNYTELSESLQKQVYDIRISESVRMQMVDSNIFSYSEHLKYIDSLRKIENKIYWVVCENNIFLSSISLHPVNWEEKWGEWGIFMNPQYAKKGIAKEISLCFFNHIASKTPLKQIKARIKQDNLRSIHFHHAVGFIDVSKDERFVYMENNLVKHE